MKRLLVGAVFTAALVGTANAQISVIDPVELVNTVELVKRAEAIVRWQEQCEQLTAQLDQMHQKYLWLTNSQIGPVGLIGWREKETYSANKVLDTCAAIMNEYAARKARVASSNQQ